MLPTWMLLKQHCTTLRQAHLCSCSAATDHPQLSYSGALRKACKKPWRPRWIRKRRLLFAGSIVRMGDERCTEKELGAGNRSEGDQRRHGVNVILRDDPRVSEICPTLPVTQSMGTCSELSWRLHNNGQIADQSRRKTCERGRPAEN